jgi:hypothetical protein
MISYADKECYGKKFHRLKKTSLKKKDGQQNFSSGGLDNKRHRNCGRGVFQFLGSI